MYSISKWNSEEVCSEWFHWYDLLYNFSYSQVLLIIMKQSFSLVAWQLSCVDLVSLILCYSSSCCGTLRFVQYIIQVQCICCISNDSVPSDQKLFFILIFIFKMKIRYPFCDPMLQELGSHPFPTWLEDHTWDCSNH